MAFITLNKEKLKSNFNYLNKIFKSNDIQWSVVSKLLCGNKDYLQVLLDLGITDFGDSRISNLKTIKQLNPKVKTTYIKPPAKRSIPSIVKYADVSLNTEINTIQLLSEEACKQNKVHEVIIMIELGELREGVMGDKFMQFYKQVFRLKNIEVVGIGTNLSCLYGVLPNHDKLIQLCLYEQLIEARFNKQIEFVSGGSSVTIPLIFQSLLPKGINHFRVGETLFLGTDVYNNTAYKSMKPDVFRLYSEIIELSEKPLVPMGEMGVNVEGEEVAFDDKNIGQTSKRAILDLGLLDVDEKHISPIDQSINFVGASSDMLVVDLKNNPNNYKVGDLIEFKMDYMGVLRIINSKYIEKRVKA